MNLPPAESPVPRKPLWPVSRTRYAQVQSHGGSHGPCNEMQPLFFPSQFGNRLPRSKIQRFASLCEHKQALPSHLSCRTSFWQHSPSTYDVPAVYKCFSRSLKAEADISQKANKTGEVTRRSRHRLKERTVCKRKDQGQGRL